MAVDTWLLETVNNPTVRFYRWETPAVSLGYRQQSDPPDLPQQVIETCDIIVRPSGGGFLYHAGELSFSILLPARTDLAEAGIKQSYTRLIEPFVEAATELELIGQLNSSAGNAATQNCLQSPADHEPVSENGKWLASAQARRRRNLLQQGSVFWSAHWHNSLEDSKPNFLGTQNRDVTINAFQKKVIEAIKKHLFHDRPPREYRLEPSAISAIKARQSNFRVDDLDELPSYDRFESCNETA